MKKKGAFFLKTIALSIFFSLLVNACSQSLKQVYISPSGNDENKGSSDAPVKSLHKAIELAVEIKEKQQLETVDIFLGNGTYFLDSTLILNPQHANLNFKRKDPQGEVIISGGRQLTNWKEENGLWVADLPKGAYFEQLWANGNRAVRARIPNLNDEVTQWHLLKSEFDVPEKSLIPNAMSIYLEAVHAERLGEVSDVEVVIFKDWAIYRKQVGRVDKKSGEISLKPPFDVAKTALGGHNTLTTLERVSGFSCYFEGSKSFIDQPGEWALERAAHKVYFKPFEGQKMESFTAIYPFVETLISVEGSKENPTSNLNFEGITLAHSKYNLPDKGHDGAQAAMFYGNTTKLGKYSYEQLPEAIRFSYAHACDFSACKFIAFGASGIRFSEGSFTNSIENSVFEDIGANAVMVGLTVDAPEDTLRLVKNNAIKSCEISYAGQHFPSGVGVWVGFANNTLIEGNHIHHLPYSGISNGWQWNRAPSTAGGNRIIDNHIHDVMLQLGDGGGIYVLGNQPGSEIIGNEIHGIHRSKYNHGAPNNGLYFDEGSKNYIARDNKIYDIAHAPVRGHRPSGVWLINNTLLPHDSISPVFVSPPYENQIKVYKNDTVYWEKPDWLDKDYDSLQLGIYMSGNVFEGKK